MSNSPPVKPVVQRLRHRAAALLELLLPQSCALCGQTCGRQAVCPECDDELPRHGQGVCPSCGDISITGAVCGRCLRHPPHVDASLAAFVYDFPVDRLVHRFKYAGHLHLARWWAKCLGDVVSGRQFDLIVPMPLHPTRLRERGFNQAVEIGRHLAPLLGIPMPLAACARIRATPPQADLERKQRLKNVRGAFECRQDLSGRRVLLVDDVMTTGASLNELARVVKLHGAVSATALVAARTLHHAT